jgi:cation:H+ antiporter
MLGLSILLLLMALGKRRRINRVEGGILVFCFMAYQFHLFYTMAA